MLGLALAMAAVMLLAVTAWAWTPSSAGASAQRSRETARHMEQVVDTITAYAHQRLVPTEEDIAAMGGLALWLDAAEATSLTLGDGGRVARWTDRRQVAAAAVQADPDSQPVFSNTALAGRPGLSFNGVSQWLAVPALALPSRMSVFIVQASVIGGSGTRFWMEHGSDTKTQDGFYFNGTTSSAWAIRRSGTLHAGPATTGQDWVGDGASQAGLVYDGTGRFYLDGTLAGSSSLTGSAVAESTVTDTLYLGSRGGTSLFLGGTLSEVLIFSSPLTASQRLKVEGYLAHKWGLVAHLPDAHPLKEPRPIACPARAPSTPTGRHAAFDYTGLESRTAGNCDAAVGLLPWQTLGLQRRDAFNAFGRPYTYAVTPALAQTLHKRGEFCAGSRLTPSTDASRLVVNAAGVDEENPAAAAVPSVVLASHGRDGVGAYTALLTRPPLPPEGEGSPLQTENHDESLETSSRHIFSNAAMRLTRDLAYFDDRVLAPTPSQLLARREAAKCR